MSKLPLLKARKLIKILNELDFIKVRQKGSHCFLSHADGRTTVVPNHSEIRIKLLVKIAKDIKLEKEEFLKLL